MHDTADLEERGIPAGFIASTEFIDAAEAQSKALGFDPARVFVPHPIQDRTEAEIRQLADDAYPQIAGMIAGKAR